MRRLSPELSRLLDQPEPVRRIGPFRLVRQLGRGGFAPVWLASEVYGDAELRLAAVKLFALGAPTPTSTINPVDKRVYRDRVVEEARALCRVEHPNVVRFYSIATDESAGVMGVAMEYLTGTSLEERLVQEAQLPLDDALALGIAVASALSAVHRVGLVHRDVKPANIIDSGGSFKLIDFGIASPDDVGGGRSVPGRSGRSKKPILVDDLPLEVTPDEKSRIRGAVTMEPRSDAASAGGTIGYVDPACLMTDAPPTPASDLYALGVVLFECVAGVHPAIVTAPPGEGMNQDLLRGLVPPPKLVDLVPHVPHALANLIDALLAAEPAKRPRSAESVAIEIERIRAEAKGSARELPPEEVGPFRGLGRFEGSDRDVYFGRSIEVASAIELLRTRGTVAIVGPSGSGKSSLARAGVLPRVESGALGRWPAGWDAVVVVPGTDPRAALLGALASIQQPIPVPQQLDPSAVVAALAERAQSTGRGVIVVMDQLEELATVSRNDAALWTAELLARIGEVPLPGVRALVTARRDLLDPLLALGGLGKVLVRGSLLVEPISETTWIGVLEEALGAYGYRLEDDALRDELAKQLKGTAGAMPLVQFALTELWNKRDVASRRVTRAGLSAIGGIAGSLERHAEATVSRVVQADPAASDAIRRTLLALTTAQGTRATRSDEHLISGERSERRGEAEGRAKDLTAGGDQVTRRVLQALESARLVVRTDDGWTLAHEALLTQWGRLASWVAEAREDRVLAEEVERDAGRWSKTPELVPLWHKRRLASALDLLRRGAAPMSAEAVTFLNTSRRAERKTMGIAVGASAAAVLALGVVAFGWVRAVRASERTAVEKAAVEQQNAALEQQKRRDLEEAQAEIDRRQTQIDALLEKLAAASDPSAQADVRREIEEARSGAKAARERIAVAMSPRKQKPAAPEAAPAAEPPTAPAPTSLKVQRE